jgi:hypothetical protein
MLDNKKDSVDIAKSKSINFANKNFARKDFGKKESSLTDSAEKYSDMVFDATRKMSKSDMIKKGIMRKITSKGDTILKYGSGLTNFERVNYKKP